MSEVNPTPPAESSAETPIESPAESAAESPAASPDETRAESQVDLPAEKTVDPYLDPATGKALIVAKPSTWYRGKRIVLVLVAIGYGCLAFRDGFYQYKKDNSDKVYLKTHHPHAAFDIPFNQAFGVGLPPLGLAFLIWTFYISRGTYRLEDDLLSIPGHPPIPLSSIQTVDRSRWDRKGIAVVEYKTADAGGTFTLDDFVYDRDPTDEIFKRIEIAVTTPA